MEASEIYIYYKNKNPNTVQLTDSEKVYEFIIDRYDKSTIEIQENVKLILLNNANRVLGVYDVSKGGTNSSIIDVKLLLAVILKTAASSIILVHNHPSGNLTPSDADIKITKKLKEACRLMDINLLDHLVISNSGFYSLADNGCV
ncbi:MAG: JAB domain-containing protein [Fermentimonas sp.]